MAASLDDVVIVSLFDKITADDQCFLQQDHCRWPAAFNGSGSPQLFPFAVLADSRLTV